ncbi:MAG: methionyl-tRNA formyltransferase [Desulfitobacterium sp.]|nr:methionyl-tRNA formyltransferase [Desulfitobacterium sp.]
MRIVYMGTPDFAVPTLRALVSQGHEVVGVFTQPDRPAGRGKRLRPSPVKVAAEEMGLEIYQPEKIKTPENLDLLKELAPEVIIVVAYGQILSEEILNLPPYGCINVHASLLPDWRGAAPIHWSIISGDKVTGVTTMQMDEGLDTGDILLKAEYPLGENTTTGEAHDALAELGAELMIKTLDELHKGEITPIPQEGETRYASLLKREDEKIFWEQEAKDIHNRIRGLNPWPGAYTIFRGENLKIRKSSLQGAMEAERKLLDQGEKTSKPGEIISCDQIGLWVQTGKGLILIEEVQPAGKKAMGAWDFYLGRRIQLGEGFGEGWTKDE